MDVKKYTNTQIKIREVAKKEFLEKGFKNASLNKIVAEAGFTKGAFYGYYPDKEALFVDLVSEAADGLIAQFKLAQDAHSDLIAEEKTAESRGLSTEYLKSFVAYMYEYYDAFKLVFCCAGGTKYEHYIDELVDLEVRRAEKYFKELKKIGKIEGSVSRELHRMITSAYFTAVAETIVRDMPKKKALVYIDELAAFFNSGWDGILPIS